MFGHDNLHSQLVGWSKIILPLCALALLSTLFLFARAPGEISDIPFAEIEALARQPQVTAPQFSGVADDGSTIAVSARNARPDTANPNILRVENLSISVDAIDGSTLSMNAGLGEIDTSGRSARLAGLARLTTSTGYVMETIGLNADLKTGVITSEGVLEVRAPYGELTAGKVTVITPKDSASQQVLFTEGVRLIYLPPSNPADTTKGTNP